MGAASTNLKVGGSLLYLGGKIACPRAFQQAQMPACVPRYEKPDSGADEGSAMMRWFTNDLVPGRHALGWFSLCVGLTAATASIVGISLGWPSWRTWALFGVGEAAAAASWYARGKTSVVLGLMGGMGVIVVLLALINPH
jgi:hypothetical protein